MTVTVNMSALWLKLTTLLCLFFTALSGPESNGVKKRDIGGTITIQCTCAESGPYSLQLRKGLNEELQVLYHDGSSKKDTIAKEFQHRLQVHAEFPKVEILIKNLTFDDTGPYWCLYQKFDQLHKMTTMKGSGSVLLVVQRDDQKTVCESSNDNLVMVSVVISAAVLLIIMIGIFIWLNKNKTAKSRQKPRGVPVSDVYEDMRGTLRR